MKLILGFINFATSMEAQIYKVTHSFSQKGRPWVEGIMRYTIWHEEETTVDALFCL